MIAYLAPLGIATVVVGAGCRSPVYRVSNLPVQYEAPSPLNLAAVNWGGLADASVSSEVIQPGDVLEVTMVTDFSKLTTTTTPVRVAENGAIAIPLVGSVVVAGFEAEQAERILASESILRGVFRNPSITVTIKQCRTNHITVVGAVNKPGTFDLPRGSCSLLGALVAAEGLDKKAGAEVEIRRTDTRHLAQTGSQRNVTRTSYQQADPASTTPSDVFKVDLTAVTDGASKAPALLDGDVVYVPKRLLKPVCVLGLVRQPGEFPFPVNQELRVLDAVALAGGYSNSLAEKILVIRRLPGEAKPIRIAINIEGAKHEEENLALAPGDIVSVENTPLTVATDFLRNFFNFGLGASVPLF